MATESRGKARPVGRARRLAIGIGLLCALVAAPVAAQEQIDHREGFESEEVDWARLAYPDATRATLEMKNDRAGAHAGRGYASIVRENDGYAYWRYDVETIPKDAKYFQVEVQARVEKLEAEGAKIPSLSIRFQALETGKDGAWKVVEGGSSSSPFVSRGGEWQKLELRGEIPAGAERLNLFLMFHGSGRARLDEFRFRTAVDEKSLGPAPARTQAKVTPAETGIAITGEGDAAHPLLANRGEERRTRVPVTVATTRARFLAQGRTDWEAAWMQVAIPREIDRQSPLAVKVATTPPGRVKGLELVRAGGNQYLRVHFDAGWDGSRLEIEVDTAVLIAPREVVPLRRAKIVDPARTDIVLRPFVGPATGIEPDHPEIAKAAAGFDRRDLGHLYSSLWTFLGENMKYAGGTDQGASTVLAAGKAVCTGYANLNASLLRACGVPTRVLSCLGVGKQLQEHYIVESWTETTGWVRLDGPPERRTSDDAYVIIRRIAPDTPRGGGCVPIYNPTVRGTVASFGYGKTEEWRQNSFQRSDLVSRSTWKGEEFRRFEKALRETLDASQGKVMPGAVLSLVAGIDLGRRPTSELKELTTWAKAWTE
ncbi:MAG: transglutaminase domain-containing protein [Planctomycetota bacterium]